MDSEKFNYFMEHTNEDLKEIKADIRQILLTQESFKRLNGLPMRVEKIEKREWKRHGAAGAIAAIIAALVAFFGKG